MTNAVNVSKDRASIEYFGIIDISVVSGSGKERRNSQANYLCGDVIPAYAGIQGPWQGGDMERQPCLYLLASKRNGTLYTAVTSNLCKRIWEHKNNVVEGFTRKYGVHTLVWYEMHDTMESAIQREKAIKNWKRAWKIKTIEALNPLWRDLYPDLF